MNWTATQMGATPTGAAPAATEPMTAVPVRPVRIRPMVVGDVDAVAAVEAVSTPNEWTRELFAGEFDVAEESRAWLVAVEESTDVVVGFCGLLFVAGSDPQEAHVMNLAVTPAWRRARVAWRLLVASLAGAAKRGVVAATLEVRASNTPAIALYEGFGFVDIGARPGYYTDGEDARILWLEDLGRFSDE